MNISVVSVFPELYTSFLQTSLVRHAQEKNLVCFDVEGFFSFVSPKQRIDAPPFGPGAGMLIKPEVVKKAVEAQENKHGPAYKIFFSPQGKRLDQRLLATMYNKVQGKGHLLLLPARYEGMDARVEQYYADEIVSVGNFVLMGGDLPAMMLIESLLRLVPGVVAKQESVERDSFFGPFVDYPEYTEPVEWKGMRVPDVVRSGNHQAIEQWRLHQAAQKSVVHHFNWVRTVQMMTEHQQQLAAEYIPPHYVALMHSDVYVRPHGTVGTTSVTSLDIHDVARSCRTYGIKNYFIVTPLEDQKKIVQTLLDFWKEGPGREYNPSRQEAIGLVQIVPNFNDVVAAITEQEGVKPVVIATSARQLSGVTPVSYYDQSLIWGQDRPVLFIFGTGNGLTDEFVQSHCDYLLLPLEGFSDFNHLSVRSAVAAVLDRWMGRNPILPE